MFESHSGRTTGVSQTSVSTVTRQAQRAGANTSRAEALWALQHTHCYEPDAVNLVCALPAARKALSCLKDPSRLGSITEIPPEQKVFIQSAVRSAGVEQLLLQIKVCALALDLESLKRQRLGPEAPLYAVPGGGTDAPAAAAATAKRAPSGRRSSSGSSGSSGKRGREASPPAAASGSSSSEGDAEDKMIIALMNDNRADDLLMAELAVLRWASAVRVRATRARPPQCAPLSRAAKHQPRAAKYQPTACSSGQCQPTAC